jgi:hypothetical protein
MAAIDCGLAAMIRAAPTIDALPAEVFLQAAKERSQTALLGKPAVAPRRSRVVAFAKR